jgi:hypothetical protein
VSLFVRHTLSWLIIAQEKIMKKIMGKTDYVADALERLDVLTKEENLMMAARTLEVAQHADDNTKVTKLGAPYLF